MRSGVGGMIQCDERREEADSQVSELKEMISGLGKNSLDAGSMLEIDAATMVNQLIVDVDNPVEVPSIRTSRRSSRRLSTFTVSSFNSMQLPKIE